MPVSFAAAKFGWSCSCLLLRKRASSRLSDRPHFNIVVRLAPLSHNAPRCFDASAQVVDCESTEDIADKMLAGPGGPIEGFRPVDERDRQALIELIERQMQETGEFIAAIKARPITAERCDPARLPADWRDLKPHPSAYVDNPAEIRDKLINHRHRRRANGNGSQR